MKKFLGLSLLTLGLVAAGVGASEDSKGALAAGFILAIAELAATWSAERR